MLEQNNGISIVKQETFIPWVQKMMPGVYDDTLSYYELLSKFVAYLNQMNDQQNEIIDWLQSTMDSQNKDIELLKKLFIDFRGAMTREFNKFTDDMTAKYDKFSGDMSREMELFKKEVIDVLLAQKVSEVLNQWFDNGKLAEIINKDVFDMKADTEWVNQLVSDLNGKINDLNNQSKYSLVNRENANLPLYIETYEGTNQVTHPKVLYFETGWNGYKYWMAYTPYPKSNDKFENPCIACSTDGINWITPVGLTNPLAQPTPDALTKGEHFSDTHLVLYGTRLECWYRYTDVNKIDTIRRRTSTDGVNWTTEEILYTTLAGKQVLSPAIMYDNNVYRMWYVDELAQVMYMESVNGTVWNIPVKVDYTLPEPYVAWHIDVVKTDIGYEMLLCVYKNGEFSFNNKVLMSGSSPDGLKWTGFKICLKPSFNGSAFDNGQIYRSTFVKIKGIYYVYYGAMDKDLYWHIGLSMGQSLNYLSGTIMTVERINLDLEPRNNLHIKKGKQILVGDNGSFIDGTQVKLVNPNVADVRLKVDTLANTVVVKYGNDSFYGDMVLRTLFLSRLDGQGVNIDVRNTPRIRYENLNPMFHLVNTNVAEAGFGVRDIPYTLDVLNPNSGKLAFVRTTGVQFGDGEAVATAFADNGLVKYFPLEGKLKMYSKDFTQWFTFQMIRKGTTRPTTNLEAGMQFFDTNLNKPIWVNATANGWVDATGTAV